MIGLVLGQAGGVDGLVLARDGKTPYAIVTGASATGAELLAAEELAAYLKRMSGAEFAIRSGFAGPADASIVVCRQGSAEAAGIEPPLGALPPEGFGLAVRGKRVYLVGADDRGVLYAAYEFLERLGCRWLAPAFAFYKGSHEVVPLRGEVGFVQAKDAVYKPVLKFRKLYVEEGHSHNAENLRQLVAWMPKLRFNTLVIPIDYSGRGAVKWDNWREALTPELKRRGICIEVGGHGYQNYLNATMEDGRLFREHADWFGMDEKGDRTPQPNRVICTSNRQAVAYLENNVLKYLKGHPEIEIFDFWPPDGAKWCTCEACKAMGSPSERHTMMVSRMAEAIRKELPQVRVECIAYSSYLEPPAKAVLDEGVLLDFCPISQCFESQIYETSSAANTKYADALRAWRKVFRGDISIYSYYRKYAWGSLPIVIPHYMQKDLRFYRETGVHGISSYAEPGDWFTYELNHYTLGHLAWDPDPDVDAVIREFCQARYGPAADTAEATFRTLEDVARHACNIPGTTLKTPAEYDAFLAKIGAAAKRVDAAGKSHSADTALAAHLRRLGLMLEYASRDISLQKQRAAKGPVAERRTMVDALAAFLEAHKDDGVFVWHRRTETEGQYKKYGAGKVAPRSE